RCSSRARLPAGAETSACKSNPSRCAWRGGRSRSSSASRPRRRRSRRTRVATVARTRARDRFGSAPARASPEPLHELLALPLHLRGQPPVELAEALADAGRLAAPVVLRHREQLLHG